MSKRQEKYEWYRRWRNAMDSAHDASRSGKKGWYEECVRFREIAMAIQLGFVAKFAMDFGEYLNTIYA